MLVKLRGVPTFRVMPRHTNVRVIILIIRMVVLLYVGFACGSLKEEHRRDISAGGLHIRVLTFFAIFETHLFTVLNSSMHTCLGRFCIRGCP